MSLLSTVRLNGFLQISIQCTNLDWHCGMCHHVHKYYITGINLVCHKYGIVTWHKNHFLHLLIKIIHHLMHCYQTISQSQETFVEGQWVHFWWLIALSTLHVWAQSPNLTVKTLTSSEMHMMQCGFVETSGVRCWYGLVDTLRLFINTLEYTELRT